MSGVGQAGVKIYDISLPLSPDTPVYPGDPPLRIERRTRLEAGNAANMTVLTIGTHVGTHVDPPLHFLAGGAAVDALPLDVLVGPARVVEPPPDVRAIGAADVRRLALDGVSRVLFKTSNSRLWREGDPRREFVHLAADAPEALLEAGVRLVGVDGLSIEAVSDRHFPCHHALLAAGVVIVEGLDLEAVPAGDYTLVCLPLRLVGGDGAPARVVLLA